MDSSAISDAILTAFPGCTAALTDAFIETNPDVLWEKIPVDVHVAVPAYMAWCARNCHRPAELVHDYTIRALAEFGRSNNPAVTHLNFKHKCTPQQKHVVLQFLQCYLDPRLLVDTRQVARSLKRWAGP